jgi:hypothetical protein
MLKNNYCILLEKFLKDLIVKKYILALLAVIIVSSTVEAASEIQISVEDGEIFSLKVSTQVGPWGTYVCPDELSLKAAVEISKTSPIVRAKLAEVLTSTLTSTVPGEWHEPDCAEAALVLDDEDLRKIALEVIKVGTKLRQTGSGYAFVEGSINKDTGMPELREVNSRLDAYTFIAKGLISNDPSLAEFFYS